jgi:hypothetical protein
MFDLGRRLEKMSPPALDPIETALSSLMGKAKAREMVKARVSGRETSHSMLFSWLS